MIKLTEKNRSLVFLAGTLIAGILVMVIIMLYENIGAGRIVIVDNPPKTNLSQLESKIENLERQGFNPDSYNTLATEIDESYRQDLITSAAKSNLEGRLKASYSTLIYEKCESFLSGSNINSSKDIQGWLTQLERISARNAKIDNYRNQINLYEYYSTKFPIEVNAFIAPGIGNYDDDKYRFLKNKAANMPGLAAEYSNSRRLKEIGTRLVSMLETFNADWATAGQ